MQVWLVSGVECISFAQQTKHSKHGDHANANI